jgi:hypothetical protein
VKNAAVLALLAAVPMLAHAAPLKDPRLVSKHDDMLDITWYHAANGGDADEQWTSVEVYFGRFEKKKTFGPLRLSATYHAQDWVFAEGLLVKLDDETPFAISMPHARRDVSNGIWEYLDVGLSPKDLGKVCSARMAKAKVVKVRFVGRERRDDFVLPDNQVEAIRMVCAAYADRNHPERGEALSRKAAKTVAKREQDEPKAEEAEEAQPAEVAKVKAAADRLAKETCRAERDAWDACVSNVSSVDCAPQVETFDTCCTKAGVLDRADCAALFFR